MKLIPYEHLIDRFSRVVDRQEAERRLGMTLKRLGLNPGGSYTPEQVTQVSGLMLSDNLEALAGGFIELAPHVETLWEQPPEPKKPGNERNERRGP